MDYFCYENTNLSIRPDLAEAYRNFWGCLGQPGAWWSGIERIAIAQASRDAFECTLCQTRKTALSPYHIEGVHDGAIDLPVCAVDAVHRIVTDQGRITATWVDANVENGLSKAAYVELTGIVVTVLSIDEFHRALGIPLEPLPAAQKGSVSRYKPAFLADDIGFVPTIPPDGAVGNEADLWPTGRTANVVRALSLVPDAVRDWKLVSDAQYLSFEEMGDFGQPGNRAINRKQIELVAARVSAINQCFY